MATQPLIPIYTTRGDADAFLDYPYIYNRNGEWIGWVTAQREVYSVMGAYVGWLSNDPRILRKRSGGYDHPHLSPPPSPPHLAVPVTVPLPPLMPELSLSTIDVLDEEPDLMPTVDFGELRPDLE